MKSVLLLLWMNLLSMQLLVAQDFVREQDKKTSKVLLRGKITFENILNETSYHWLEQGANAYNPQPNVVNELSKMHHDYRFVVFVGTWCSDTKELLPKFYKVLNEAGIDLHSVEMYGVNRSKEALNEEDKVYGIKYVPTIIVLYKSREIGRIVESVNSSIEEELKTIISKDYDMVQTELQKKYR